MYDGSADPLLAPPPANRARSRGSSVIENIEEAAAVWEKAFAGYQLEQLERGKKKRSGSASCSVRLRAASYEDHLRQDDDPSARHTSLTIDGPITPGEYSSTPYSCSNLTDQHQVTSRIVLLTSVLIPRDYQFILDYLARA